MTRPENAIRSNKSILKMISDSFRYPLTSTEKLNFEEIPGWVYYAARILMDNQKAVYLVGGAVRDLLWGITPSDWDLATDALPGEIENIYPQTIPTGKRFGTITVFIDEHQMEVTTLREDFEYNDGRRPDQVVFSSSILNDLARRDFTINAMAYDFNERLLIDPFKGRTDCYHRVIKAVGDPRVRFQEDGLRMFRFYRFLASHNLTPERETKRAINPEWADSISYERIRDEFSKLLLGKAVRKGLVGLIKSGLLPRVIPEFFSTAESQTKLYSYLREHSLSAVDTIRPILHLRLAALLHDIAKPLSVTMTESGVHFYGHDQKGADISRAILERLRYPNKLIKKVFLLIRWHMFFYQPNISDSAIRRLISKVGPEIIPDLLELRRADIVATGKVTTETPDYWKDLSERILTILKSGVEVGNSNRLAINGYDLIERLSINPGPLVGEILAYLLENVFEDPDLNRKEPLLDLALRYLESKSR